MEQAASASRHTGSSTRQMGMLRQDVVLQDRIWSNALKREKKRGKDWEAKWKFMLEFDYKGNPIKRMEDDLDEKVAEEDGEDGGGEPSSVINRRKTDASNYGCRLETDTGQRLLSMQSKLIADSRKKKMARELFAQ